MPTVAGLILATSAEEVEVTSPVSLGLRHEHPHLYSGVMTLATPKAALEVVVVGALPNAVAASSIEDDLDPVECLGGNKRFVPPVELLAFVGDIAEVVTVSKQDVELR